MYLLLSSECGGLTVGTELDEHGNVRVGMRAFKKVELCTMVDEIEDMTDGSMVYFLGIFESWKLAHRRLHLRFLFERIRYW